MALKKVFSKDNKTCKVTFTVGKDECKDTEFIYLAGDFNQWSSTATPLKKQKDGSFTTTVELPVDQEIQFRYLYDGKYWENDWEADSYVPSYIGFVDNSVVITKKLPKKQ